MKHGWLLWNAVQPLRAMLRWYTHTRALKHTQAPTLVTRADTNSQTRKRIRSGRAGAHCCGVAVSHS